MAGADLIEVEVVYALPGQQRCVRVKLAQGSTAGQAITHSGILGDFPALDISPGNVGIFARIVDLNTVLCHGDRVEIYRPLQVDPKGRRRARAKARRDT